MNETGARDDLLAGAIFIVLGGGFAYTAATYDVGSLRSMGPGYFPLTLGLVLVTLGVVIMAVGLLRLVRERSVVPSPASGAHHREVAAAPTSPAGATELGTEAEERGSVPWGRAALILGAILFFGATISGLGVGPALLVTVFLAALAGHGTSWRTAAVISIGLAVLCVLVFVMLLQLRLPVVGPWLGG